MNSRFNSPAVKDFLCSLLRRVGVYERTKASWIYDLYWRLADRRIIDDRRQEIDFYRNLLDGFHSADLVFDIGANQGYKTDIFLRLGAKVVAVEPDETSQEALRQKFLKYRLRRKQLVIVSKAVSDSDSPQTMWIDAPGSAKNTLSQKWVETLRADDKRFGHALDFGHGKQIETMTIEQLIAQYGSPFFIKIDVEGHELSVVRGMRRPVPFLSFEVNLPEFKTEGLECIRVLARLAPSGKFNFTPNCRKGLELNRWLGPEEFSAVLHTCRDESMEVFWKNVDGPNVREKKS